MPHNPCNRWPHRPRICPARPCTMHSVCHPALQLPDPLTALIDLVNAVDFGTQEQLDTMLSTSRETIRYYAR